MNTSLKIAIGSFLAAAAVIKGAPALAEPAQPQNVSIVRTADLDLSSETGRRHLEQRLIGAARDVCGTASDVDLEGKNEVRACRSEVLDKARSQGEQLASRGGPDPGRRRPLNSSHLLKAARLPRAAFLLCGAYAPYRTVP